MIRLSGNNLIVTKDSSLAYKITSGKALVFVAPIDSNITGRRNFILECQKGDVIPSLYHKSEKDLSGTLCNFCFVIVPLEECELEEIKCEDSFKEKFCKKADLKTFKILGFEESCVEHYRLQTTRNERNLYAAEKENSDAVTRSLEGIARLFTKKKLAHSLSFEPSGIALYDACAAVCSWQNIHFIDSETLIANCTRKFTVNDFARISGFICRKVVLDDSWYKEDIGPILAFTSDEVPEPVAIIPVKNNKYVAYFAESNKTLDVTESVASTVNPSAYMFYRPFPNEKMGLWSLIKFGLKDINIWDLTNVFFMTLLVTIIGLLVPKLNETIFDKFIPIGNIDSLYGVSFVIVSCMIANVAFSVVKNLCNFRAINKMKYSVQAGVFDRLFNLPESFFRSFTSADLATRAIAVGEIFSILVSTVISVGITLVFSVLYLFKMYKYAKKMANMALLMLLLLVAIVYYISLKQTKLERKKLEIDSDITSVLFQLISGISKIRMSGSEKRGLYEYMKRYTNSCSLQMKAEKYTHIVTVTVGVIPTIFSMVFYFVMIRNSLSLSIGQFMGFSSAFGSVSAAVFQVCQSLLIVNNVIPIFERLKPILETLPEKNEDLVMPGRITGDIEIDNVSFRYDKEAPLVLDNISLHIKPGEYLGVVGSSGCGKSTLLKLLLGFEKPESGKIYYDNRDIDSIDKRELRKKFGVVLQDGGLITGSIHDNIAITNPSATLDQVKEAAAMAGLERDIAMMPMGLHTVLAEGAGGISGGQKQRVLIARAIIGKPKVLFFDEATSALDNKTQDMVCESLEKLKATRIVIAHRLSTIQKCDRIIVMDKGKIAEEGSYDKLMEKKGLFYQLAIRQID